MPYLIVPGLMLATGMPIINEIGTSLLSVAASGLATALSYASSGLVDWRLASEFIGGGVLGMLLATRLSAYKNILNLLFAALILWLLHTFCIGRSLQHQHIDHLVETSGGAADGDGRTHRV